MAVVDDDDVVFVVSVLVILDRALGNTTFTNSGRDPATEVPWNEGNLLFCSIHSMTMFIHSLCFVSKIQFLIRLLSPSSLDLLPYIFAH